MKVSLPKTMLLVVLLLASLPLPLQAQDTPVVVGHISFLHGSLARYVPETSDWIAMVQDAPVGPHDTLSAAEDARAEIIFPGSIQVRIGSNTLVQFLRIDAELVEFDITRGTVRINNRSSSAAVKATTPFGYVVIPAQTFVDVYVRNTATEMVCMSGGAYFVHAGGTSKYELAAGQGSLVAEYGRMHAGTGQGDNNWIAWNTERDRFWESRRSANSTAHRYLPEQLHDEAYALEENGKWEQVYYEGRYHSLWRPTHVPAGWAPFTAGRWTMWYGDHCWIPDEPFGYLTHHYGTWLYIDSCRCWYWMPPLITVMLWPSYGHPCAWYPGRVAWLYSDLYIGWVPLLPYEPYYCSFYWGPGVIVVTHSSAYDRHHHKHHHQHDRHAVLVRKNDLYTVRNYHAAGIRHRTGDVGGQELYATPVLHEKIMENDSAFRDQISFDTDRFARKPTGAVLDRIQKNLARIKRENKFTAAQLVEKVQRLRPGVLHVSQSSLGNTPQHKSVLSRNAWAAPLPRTRTPHEHNLLHQTKPVPRAFDTDTKLREPLREGSIFRPDSTFPANNRSHTRVPRFSEHPEELRHAPPHPIFSPSTLRRSDSDSGRVQPFSRTRLGSGELLRNMSRPQDRGF